MVLTTPWCTLWPSLSLPKMPLDLGAACSESPLVGVESTGAETYLSQPIKEEPIRLNSTAMRGAVGGAHVFGGWLHVLVTP